MRWIIIQMNKKFPIETFGQLFIAQNSIHNIITEKQEISSEFMTLPQCCQKLSTLKEEVSTSCYDSQVPLFHCPKSIAGCSQQATSLSMLQYRTDRNFQDGLNLLPLKILSGKDQFHCQCSRNSKGKQFCTICSGLSKLDGENNIVKFIEYIMEFKLRLKESYHSTSNCLQNQNKMKKINKYQSVNYNYKQAKATHSLLTLQEYLKRREKNYQTHVGYRCDGCGMDPIQGNRYHCPHNECSNDYDLCSLCFSKVEHRHVLDCINENGFREYIKNTSHILKASQKLTISSICKNTRSALHDKNRY